MNGAAQPARQRPEGAARAVQARFAIGTLVRHVSADLRGIIVDVDAADPVPDADAPLDTTPQAHAIYKVLARGEGGLFLAGVAEDQLVADPLLVVPDEEELDQWFTRDAQGRRAPWHQALH